MRPRTYYDSALLCRDAPSRELQVFDPPPSCAVVPPPTFSVYALRPICRIRFAMGRRQYAKRD